MVKVLNDRNFKITVILSIGACLPNFIDIIYESYNHVISGVKLDKKVTNQWYFTVCFFIPNVIIYFNTIPKLYFESLPIIYSLKIISIYLVLILNILNYGKHILRKIHYIIALCIILSYELVIIISIYSIDNFYYTIYIDICNGIILFTFIFVIFYWYQYISHKHLDTEDYICSLYLCLLFLIFFSRWVIETAFSHSLLTPSWWDRSSGFLIAEEIVYLITCLITLYVYNHTKALYMIEDKVSFMSYYSYHS